MKYKNSKEATAFYGNKDLLALPKTAFLCSRIVSTSTVLKCYDWAIEQRHKGNCIISGFQSQIEKDVLHYLLQGNQPIIIALARGMKKQIEPELCEALSNNRLLIVSPFPDSVKRSTVETAEERNRIMIEMADKVVFGYIKEDGALSKLKQKYESKIKMTILCI
jgi:predicted Rossmann fold nucleotide-binding protein DprA/Smf involved in DNA uptake